MCKALSERSKKHDCGNLGHRHTFALPVLLRSFRRLFSAQCSLMVAIFVRFPDGSSHRHSFAQSPRASLTNLKTYKGCAVPATSLLSTSCLPTPTRLSTACPPATPATQASAPFPKTIMSNAIRRRTSMITLPSQSTSVDGSWEAPLSRSMSLKAPVARRASSYHPSPVSACEPRTMLSKINTSLHSPDRPPRRPYGPRSALTPSPASAKYERRTPIVEVWKSRRGPTTIRTSPPQTSLP